MLKGVIGGLAGVIGILIIVIVVLLYIIKSGKLVYTGWCNIICWLLTSDIPL
jgi:hypothetical protein